MKRTPNKKITSQEREHIPEKKVSVSDEALREVVKKLIGSRVLEKGRSRSDLKKEIFYLKQSSLNAKHKGGETTKNKADKRKKIAEDIFTQLEKAGERIIDNTGRPIKRTEIFKMVSPRWEKGSKLKCPKQDTLYNYLKDYINRKKG